MNVRAFLKSRPGLPECLASPVGEFAKQVWIFPDTRGRVVDFFSTA